MTATCGEHAEAAVRGLCHATGLDQLADQVAADVRLMGETWRHRPLDAPPAWSTLTADSTPLELSVVLGDEPLGLRASVEAHAEPANPVSYWESARRLNARLSATHGLDLSRLRRIEHLVAPRPADRPPMAAFHTMGWVPRRPPIGKIHLWHGGPNPADTAARVDAALSALGFPGQWQVIAGAMHDDDTVSYLCLDLATGPSARTKLYVQHRGVLTAERLARWDRLGPRADLGDGPTMAAIASRAWARSAWAPGTPPRTRLEWRSNHRRFWSYGTYVSLVPGGTRPIESVMHQFGLTPRCRSDAEAQWMIREVLDAYDVSARSRDAYERCARFFMGGEADKEMYAHSFLSAQRSPHGPARIAVYFNPRMYFRRHGLTNGDLARAEQFQSHGGDDGGR
ncbi:hypothetical protein ACFY2R_17880 [Micromonospora olivasterospora]|uniref:Uncharacterized protein n=1 Tax=Micromonospora olivasterospora TaxID=1880 RepID=A0A562IIQ3_MICOL|nr:hypothetical protein [Micromonospora olivasterospora]TWH70696.1 hypothetical protein JD77_05721 [Micromonospora olivasterospora]